MAEALKTFPDSIRCVDASWHLGGDRDARKEFEQAHLPGAVFFDIDDVADKSSDLPHMFVLGSFSRNALWRPLTLFICGCSCFFCRYKCSRVLETSSFIYCLSLLSWYFFRIFRLFLAGNCFFFFPRRSDGALYSLQHGIAISLVFRFDISPCCR